MNIKVNGQVRYIGSENTVKGDKGTHSFKILIVETLDKLSAKKMDAIEKLIMINTFGEWWYPLHKSVFQEIMIETLC